jgi:antitoxin component HigA of HigAB toxin-antitoxin module
VNIQSIKTDTDHEAALREIEALWGAAEGTPEGDRLDVLMKLIEAYEDHRWPIDFASLRKLRDRLPYQEESAGDLIRKMRDSARY